MTISTSKNRIQLERVLASQLVTVDKCRWSVESFDVESDFSLAFDSGNHDILDRKSVLNFGFSRSAVNIY